MKDLIGGMRYSEDNIGQLGYGDDGLIYKKRVASKVGFYKLCN